MPEARQTMSTPKRRRSPSGKELPDPPKRTPLPQLLPYFLLLIAVVLAYGQATGFRLTAFDDDKIMSAFDGHGYSVADALTSNAFMEHKGKDFYRPLQSLVYMVDSALSGSDPWAWHANNLLIHYAAVCCLLRLLLLLGFGRLRSTGAALLFAVQPIFAQAAAWIPGCGDLLLGLFGLLAFVALIRYVRAGSAGWLLLHGVALTAALLSKENGLVLPFLFALYLALAGRKQAFRKASIPLAAVWIAESAGYLLLRNAAMAGLPADGNFGVAPLLGNIRALPELIAGLAFPYDLPVMPSFTVARSAAGIVLVAALVLVLIAQRRIGKKTVLFGALWFVALSIPGMLYRQELGRFAFTYLYHRSYLPMAGLWIVLLEAAPPIRSAAARRYALWLLVAAVAASTLLARRQASFFANKVAFYNQAIRTNPQSAFALNNRASLRAAEGDVAGAAQDMDRALRLCPDFTSGLLNRGIIYAWYGDSARARVLWQRAAELGNGMAREMLGGPAAPGRSNGTDRTDTTDASDRGRR